LYGVSTAEQGIRFCFIGLLARIGSDTEMFGGLRWGGAWEGAGGGDSCNNCQGM